jgi:hypothetical protein
MAIELVPIPLPNSANASKLSNFGREVRGVNAADIVPGSELFKEIESALYTVCFKERWLFPIQLDPSIAHCSFETQNSRLLSSIV